jgi:cell division protein FtsN
VILLELDPNMVKPGWTALIVTLLLAVAMVFLFLSMRKQFRKISIPRQETDDQPPTPTEPTAGTSAE